VFPPLKRASGYVLTKRKYLHDKVRAEHIAIGEGVVGHVAETKEGLLISDARNESRIPAEAHELVPLEAMMLMPQAAVTVNIVQLYDELGEKQRIESELQVAKEFQTLLLPRDMPRLEGFEIATVCSPALEMGGDFFDFINLDDHHLGIVIADVSGKGIPGALIMAAVRSALRAEAFGRLSPAETLRVINQRVYEDTRENVFITMTYAILDKRSNILRFARAGHEPLIAVPEGNARPILYTPEGIALGLVEGEIFNANRGDDGGPQLHRARGALHRRRDRGHERQRG
jgi:sigma-B regulation protein RsbU (phosphoserine phosphatase)